MRFMHLLLAAFLAGPALALNVTVGTTNFTAPGLVEFGNDNFLGMANCSSLCTTAHDKLNCGNDQCACTDDAGAALLQCEQCLFTYVIDMNIVPPNVLMGSQPALSAFVSACAATPAPNLTIHPLKLALPPSWDGPQANKLGTVMTVVAVAAGAILGSGSLFVLSNIE